MPYKILIVGILTGALAAAGCQLRLRRGPDMPTFFICAVNSDFTSRDEGAEYDRPEDAMIVGVHAAVSLAADEIYDGKVTSAIEVIIENELAVPQLRSIVTLAIHQLGVAIV